MKTWEMLKDIKSGDIYKVINTNLSMDTITLLSRGHGVVWDQTNDPLRLTVTILEEFEWEKVPKIVDWDEAFVAFEDGKVIRSVLTGCTRRCKNLSNSTTEFEFSYKEIKDQWEIID